MAQLSNMCALATQKGLYLLKDFKQAGPGLFPARDIRCVAKVGTPSEPLLVLGFFNCAELSLFDLK